MAYLDRPSVCSRPLFSIFLFQANLLSAAPLSNLDDHIRPPGDQQIRPQGKDAFSILPGQLNSSGIQVDDTVIAVKNKHCILHVVEHQIMGNGNDIQKPVSENPPTESQAGDGEHDRGHIKIGKRGNIKKVHHVSDPWHANTDQHIHVDQSELDR